MNDPQIRNLASAAGGARAILYQLMIQHMNKGKTTRRLTPRSQELIPVVTDAARVSTTPPEAVGGDHNEEREEEVAATGS